MAWIRFGSFTDKTMWFAFLSEFVACTFVLMMAQFLQVTLNEGFYVKNQLHVGLALGLIVFNIAETFGPIHGAQVNPMMAFVLCISGQFTVLKALLYTVAEVAGAAAGASIVVALTPADYTFTAIRPSPLLTTAQSILTEAVLSVFLVFIILAVTDARARKVNDSLVPFNIGFAIAVCILCSANFTGAAMNPLIAFGPALAARDFRDHYVYWAGPYAGGVVGLVLYKLLMKLKRLAEDEGDGGDEASNMKYDDDENGVQLGSINKSYVAEKTKVTTNPEEQAHHL